MHQIKIFLETHPTSWQGKDCHPEQLTSKLPPKCPHSLDLTFPVKVSSIERRYSAVLYLCCVFVTLEGSYQSLIVLFHFFLIWWLFLPAKPCLHSAIRLAARGFPRVQKLPHCHLVKRRFLRNTYSVSPLMRWKTSLTSSGRTSNSLRFIDFHQESVLFTLCFAQL